MIEAFDGNRQLYASTNLPLVLARFMARKATQAGIGIDIAQRAYTADHLLDQPRRENPHTDILRRMKVAAGAARMLSAFNRLHDEILDGRHGTHAAYELRWYGNFDVDDSVIVDAIEESMNA